MPLNVLQISDCHLVVEGARLIGVDTQASLEAVLAQALAEHQADAIIASGDLAHDPVPEVYARLLATVRRYFSGPLLCLPGNHDVLAMMQTAGLPLDSVALPPWELLGLDSHEDELPRALVDDRDRRQVAAAMVGSAQPNLLVATHHPLLDVDCPWLDCDRIKNSEELVTWLRAHSDTGNGERLRAVVHGHAHQEVDELMQALPVLGAPSTCFQFKPRSRKFALDEQPPGYRWLYLQDDGRLNSAVGRVASFAIETDLAGVNVPTDPPQD